MGEFFGWIFLGVLCFFGYTLFKKGYQKKYQLTVYEFENRTDGGVVKFDSFDDVEKHKKNDVFSDFSMLFGVALMGLGALIVGVILKSVNAPFVVLFGLIYLAYLQRKG